MMFYTISIKDMSLILASKQAGLGYIRVEQASFMKNHLVVLSIDAGANIRLPQQKILNIDDILSNPMFIVKG
jgi:hypothetical protein